MKIRFTRKARYVRLSKGDFRLVVAALAASQAQAVQDGARAAYDDQGAFIVNADNAVRIADLRNRLIRAGQAL